MVGLQPPSGSWDCACPGKPAVSSAAAYRAMQNLEKLFILRSLPRIRSASLQCCLIQPIAASAGLSRAFTKNVGNSQKCDLPCRLGRSRGGRGCAKAVARCQQGTCSALAGRLPGLSPRGAAVRESGGSRFRHTGFSGRFLWRSRNFLVGSSPGCRRKRCRGASPEPEAGAGTAAPFAFCW